MDSKQIRSKFLSFFESKNHKIVPSAPIVLKNDPTLMFTNAGMNQFKDYFLGTKNPEQTRVADTQKCLRVSGKHNDLEEVGFDTYHHTMFEMLGNWSFGDYFKEDAINWAWELLTEEFDLPKDRMYATIFEGDKSENLDRDEEAFKFWQQHLPDDRILNGNKKDNFWEMGDTGPCGPCSEIHIDLRDQEEVDKLPGHELVNQDHPLVVEVWNLVFIQFNRKADQSLENLPNKHVDTGMGFERLAMAVQGKKSNYDTDVFQPLIQKVASKAGLEYGADERTDIAIRVISDHIRAISFTIADGQLPSNTGAGYVIRRILRRAVRYGYTYLGFSEPVLHDLVDTLASQFKETFPELHEQLDFVKKVVFEEETSFLRTLENGLKRLESFKNDLESNLFLSVNDGKTKMTDLNEVHKQSLLKSVIPGSVAFELYDTYGFPLDLTSLIARENGLQVDEEGFKMEMEIQRNRSKSDAQKSTGDWMIVREGDSSSFVGYDQTSCQAQILRYRELESKGKKSYQVVLDKTPFYAESGGQVGDTGILKSADEEVYVIDTKKENELTVHFVKALPKNLEATFQAVVNEGKRSLTENNHSATHLLHAALRSVLGDHVQQRGSLVNDKVLRFDFSHFSKMSEDEIKKVERIVNAKIRENIDSQIDANVPIAEAKERGAMALFGEKYGDSVRVVTFDPNYSIELCGGTHVDATGRIGLFKIVSEGSVAAGVRRIEAMTAAGAEAYLDGEMGKLEVVRELLKQPKDLEKAISDLLKEKELLQKELESAQKDQGQQIKTQLVNAVEQIGGANVIKYKGGFPSADVVKQLSFDLKNEVEDLVLVVAAEIKGKPQLSVMLGDSIVSKGLNAGEMVRTMAKEIQGGGGGQPFYATAGGKKIEGLAQALKVAEEIILKKLKG